jgi:hypothetical protein
MAPPRLLFSLAASAVFSQANETRRAAGFETLRARINQKVPVSSYGWNERVPAGLFPDGGAADQGSA